MAKQTPNDDPKVISIDSSGNYTPPGGVEIKPSGLVRFDVDYPDGAMTCFVEICSISFDNPPQTPKAGTHTIKVGSGLGAKRRK